MYKTPDKSQPSFLDFNQPLGLWMDPANCWVQLAARVPWDIFEEKYAALFPSGTGEENRLAYVAFSRARYLLALGIPKPKSFSETDRKILEDAGFKIVES